MLDTVQVQVCKNKQIEQSRAFAQSYYMDQLYVSVCTLRMVQPITQRSVHAIAIVNRRCHWTIKPYAYTIV